MRKSKGLVSLEVVILAALGIIIATALLERCLNKKVLINQYNENSSIEAQKDYEILEFLREFVDIFNKEMVSKDIENTEEFSSDVVYDDSLNEEVEKVEEFDEGINEVFDEKSKGIQTIKSIIGESGYSKNGRVLKYSEANEEFILIDKIINYQRKCYYYDYEFIEGNIVLEKRRYYDYYK